MLRINKGLKCFFTKQARLGLLENKISPAADFASTMQASVPEVSRDLFIKRLSEISDHHKHNTPFKNILSATVLGGLGGTLAASGYHGYKHFVNPNIKVIPFGYGPLIGAGLGASLGTLEELLMEGPRRRNHQDLLELLVPISASLFKETDPSVGYDFDESGKDEFTLRQYTPNGG